MWVLPTEDSRFKLLRTHFPLLYLQAFALHSLSFLQIYYQKKNEYSNCYNNL